jgi:transcription elongation factor B subunit 1
MSEESEYVTLISSDGYSFIVQRSSACISGAIKRMLDPSCTLEPYDTRSHMPS